MKKLPLFLLLLMASVLFSCRGEEPDAGQLAGEVAQNAYDLLLQGKYEDFVAACDRTQKVPEGYKEQLVTNAKMFVEQQKKEHGGMCKIGVVGTCADTAKHVAQVYLLVTYGDSTKEQVLVPMVEKDGKWLMR